MSLTTVIVLVSGFFIAAYAVILYNGLVRLKRGVGKAWANIDVLLRQRHEELPKLVETCKQYMQHERNTLEQVIRARGEVASARELGDIGSLGRAETGLRSSLGRLFALAENYPQLKADSSFAHLQQRISGLESGIADRRELYNESGKPQQRTHRAVSGCAAGAAVRLQAGVFARVRRGEKADVNLKALFG